MKKIYKALFDAIFINEPMDDIFENIMDYIFDCNFYENQGDFPDSFNKSFLKKYPLLIINNDDFQCSFFIVFDSMEEYNTVKKLREIFQDRDPERLEIIDIRDVEYEYDNWYGKDNNKEDE